MKYKEGDFVAEEPARRALRDKYRAKFFKDLGLKPLGDPFGYDPDPATQLDEVSGLIDKALSLHEGDTAGLDALKAEVSAATLGVPQVGGRAVGRPVFQKTTVTAWKRAMFSRARKG